MSENTNPIITITASTAVYLSECNRKFHELAVQRRYAGVDAMSPALRFGIACHDALRACFAPAPGVALPRMETLPALVRAAFARQWYQNEEGREHDIKRATKLICNYCTEDLNDGDSDATIAVEQRGTRLIEAGETRYFISARLDRVLCRAHQPDVLVVRDYKMGDRPLEESQAVINLAVAKALFPGYESGYVLEIDSLSDEQTRRQTFRSCELKGAIARLTAQVRAYERDLDHAPTYGSGCQYCDLRERCQGQSPLAASDLEF